MSFRAKLPRVSRRKLSYVLFGGLIVFLLLLPPVYLGAYEYRMTIVTGAFFYAIMSSSWALLAGIAGQFSFGHMAFMGIGAYTAGLLGRDGIRLGLLALDIPPESIPPILAVVAGTLAAGLIGLLIGYLVLRLRAAYLALFTIAFSELLRIVILTEFEYTEGTNGLQLRSLFPASTAYTNYYIMLLLLIAALGFMYVLSRSRIGMFLRAMREDEEAAAAMGVNVVRYKVLIFVITSMIVGLAGAIFYHQVGIVTPNTMELLQMSLVIAYAVIGGMESLIGAAIGAIISRILLELLREFTLPFGLSVTIGETVIGPTIETGFWRFAAFGLVMMFTLRFARNGLLHPVLQWFSERDIALQETVSKRQMTGDSTTESSLP
jgi:branched-chain amino acid transport system permease protein